jgi:hypothetical protein
MSYDNLSSISRNVLKFYQQLTGKERRLPFIFDDFHFCRSRVIRLDMTENRIFTLCRMITWVVFLGMFWIYPPLPTSVQPISITKTLLIVPTKNERDPPLFTGKLLIKFQNIHRIFTLCRMITWVVFLGMFWNFISSLPVKRGSISFLFIFTFAIPELK